jgi:16S rRNA (cytidine1402-2'-O)-methyltransferase
LHAADLIACEDTRVFAKLAGHYGIAAPTVAYSDATQDAAEPRIVRALADGKRVALVSDAGMPLISDPGYRLVRAASARGLVVTSAPGLACRWRWRSLGCGRSFFLAASVEEVERRRAIAAAAGVPARWCSSAPPPRASLADRPSSWSRPPARVASFRGSSTARSPSLPRTICRTS